MTQQQVNFTYVDKGGRTHTYKLYSGSLIKNGTFIVIVIVKVLIHETAGHESQGDLLCQLFLSDTQEH